MDSLYSQSYTQRDFFKNSLLNSYIIFRNIVKDYFKHFLFNLTPMSRYEYWCFIFMMIVNILMTVSILSLIYIAFPSSKMYLQVIFYVVLFAYVNIGMRATSSRLISVKNYISSIPVMENQNRFYAMLENAVKNLFLSVPLYIALSYIKITFYILYFINLFLLPDENQIIYITKFSEYSFTYLLVFLLKLMTLVYLIFMVAPSLKNMEYLSTKHVKYYKIFPYTTWYTKEFFVDNLTLLAGIFAVISTGHILILGYSLSLHILLSVSAFCQSIALVISGRFFSILLGLISLVLIFASSLYLIFDGIDYSLYHPETIMSFVKYNQVVTAVLFVGIFYYTSYDLDLLKIISVLGFYAAALFIWTDSSTIKSVIMHDTQLITILFYGLLELLFIFIYLIRVANNKGFNKAEMKYFSMLRGGLDNIVEQTNEKHIYIIMLASSFFMVLYSLILFVFPVFSSDILQEPYSKSMNILVLDLRKYVALYMFLSFYMLFKNYKDIFPMFLVSFIFFLEIYVILFPSLSHLLISITSYSYSYTYMYIYGLMSILSLSLLKYNKYIAYGYGTSLVPFIFTLIGIFTNLSYKNNYIIYFSLFFALVVANTLVCIGAYKQIKISNLKAV